MRAQPDLFGQVASDPTVSRLIAALAVDGPVALAAVRRARAAAREQAWRLSPPVAPDGPVIVDLDATIVLAHSEKEGATPTWKRTFGFHPLLAFLDHGPGGTGEQLAGLLRIGKATANDAADHIAVLTDALAQLPAEQRSRVLIRGDSGAGVHAFLHHLHALGLPHGFAANQLWLEIVALAGDLLAWTQHLALTGTPARTWEPKRLRLRLLNIAGRVATSGRQRSLRLPRGWPWNDPLIQGHARLHALTT